MSMPHVRMTDSAMRTRHVEVTDQLAITLDEDPGAAFPCKLLSETIPSRPSDASPRETAARQQLLFENPQELRSADRVEITGTTYELLSDPRPLRLATKVLGYSAEVMPAEKLYPVRGDLQEQGGDVVQANVKLSIYQPTDVVAGAGDFGDQLGQAPCDYYIALEGRNRALAIGTQRFVIAEALPVFESAYMQLRLRRSRG